MERFEITAKHFFGNEEDQHADVHYTDLKGTFAEKIYRAVDKKIWEDIQGCSGCAFEDEVEWEMPCMKCKRIAKDYYRQPRGEED